MDSDIVQILNILAKNLKEYSIASPKEIIEEEKKKLTSKDIKIITNFNKEKRDIHSYFRSIYFDGKIDFNLNELDGTLAHELTHIKILK